MRDETRKGDASSLKAPPDDCKDLISAALKSVPVGIVSTFPRAAGFSSSVTLSFSSVKAGSECEIESERVFAALAAAWEFERAK